MKIFLRDIQQHKQETARYKCVICQYVDPVPKVAALPARLPAFHEAYCPNCKANRKFIKVK